MGLYDAIVKAMGENPALLNQAQSSSGQAIYAPTGKPMSATNNPYVDSRMAAQQLLAQRNARMQPRSFESTGQPEWARGSASWGRYSQPVAQQQQIRQQNFQPQGSGGRRDIAAMMATPTSLNQRYLNNPGAAGFGGLSPQMPRQPQVNHPALANLSPQTLAHPALAPSVAAHSVAPTSPIPGETVAQQAVRQKGYYYPTPAVKSVAPSYRTKSKYDPAAILAYRQRYT